MEEIIDKHFFWLFFSALFLSSLLTPRTRRLAVRLGAVDAPDPRKIHERTIPRLGGLGIAVSVLIFMPLFGESGKFLDAFLVGAFVTATVGFLDDVFHFRPLYKLLGQTVAVVAFVFLGGGYLRSLGDFAAIGEIRLGMLAPGFTVFCMVGVMNALNLSDGLDGLAGGMSAIACFFLGIFSFLQRDWLSLSITVCLLGSIFGFLRYNTFPAKLFMGDTGSMLLGFSLAAVAVRLAEFEGAVRFSPMSVATVLALPILDTLLVMVRRLLRCESPFRPDKKHLHHLLLDLGFSHAAVVPILYGVMTAFGLVAYGTRDSAEWVQFSAVVALGGGVYGTLFLYKRLAHRLSGLFRGEIRYRKHSPPMPDYSRLTQWAPLVSWVITIGLCIPVVLSGHVQGNANLLAFAMACFMIALFPWQARRRHAALCHGLLYSSCVCLVGILQMGPGAASWVEGYMAAFSFSVLTWALLMMKSRPFYVRLLVPTGFETLLIGMCMLVSAVLVPALGLENSIRRAALIACVESVPFLLAFKILIRRKPARNYIFAIGFLLAFLFLGIRGISSVDTVLAWNRSPAAIRTIETD
jgi:UDP-GlcNAc:undecaprenyl-phosphate GlcNAc-1-phosphate transferase